MISYPLVKPSDYDIPPLYSKGEASTSRGSFEDVDEEDVVFQLLFGKWFILIHFGFQ